MMKLRPDDVNTVLVDNSKGIWPCFKVLFSYSNLDLPRLQCMYL